MAPRREGYSLNTLANLLAWFPVYHSTNHPSTLNKWRETHITVVVVLPTHILFLSGWTLQKVSRNSGCDFPICGWKHWVSKRFGHHVLYGILQEPCLKLLHWPYCYGLFLLNTICFPAPVPTCTVIKLSCLFRDTQWLPIVYSVTSTWHSWHGLPSAYLSPRYRDHTPQHPESLILRYDQHFYSSVTLLVPILYPVLLFISWSSILESFRLSSNKSLSWQVLPDHPNQNHGLPLYSRNIWFMPLL